MIGIRRAKLLSNPILSNKPKDDDWDEVLAKAISDGIVLPEGWAGGPGYTLESYAKCECGAEATYGKETADAAKLHAPYCARYVK
jgi:hypothetical protein